jgi:lambda family phage portal protein
MNAAAPLSMKNKLLGFFGHNSDASMSADSAHAAASRTDARMADWIPSPGSADADILPEWERATHRSRDSVRNSPLAGGYVQTGKDNVIGHQLRLSSKPDYRLLGRDAQWARDWATNTEAQFRTWANTPDCDAARTQTLWGLARTSFGGLLQNGDCLTVPKWIPRPGSRWATRLQNIESDQLSTPPLYSGNPRLRGGVELDRDWAPIAYHIRTQHPGDNHGLLTASLTGWERIPAFTAWGRRRVIHAFDKERAGQNRGMTVFSRILRESRVLSEYVGHENHAALANSLIAGFLESDLPPEQVSELFGGDIGTASDYYKEVAEKYHRKKMEGGLFLNLPLGTKLSGFNSSRPNVAFEPFVRFMIRYLSAGLNVPYELLLKDFSQTNYSSARAALLEAWRYFLSCRQLFVDMWLQPVFLLWLEEAVDKGAIEAPDFYGNEYAYSRCRWIFAGRGWVDPVKEITAAQMRMDYDISTLEDESAEQGRDWEENLEQKAIEMRRRMELDEQYGLAGVYSLAAPKDAKVTIVDGGDSAGKNSQEQDKPA